MLRNGYGCCIEDWRDLHQCGEGGWWVFAEAMVLRKPGPNRPGDKSVAFLYASFLDLLSTPRQR